MSRSIGLAHIIRHDDGTSTGVWGLYTLKSAFQPIFAFREGKLVVVAFEGLIRPFRDGEPQSPAQFFGACPVAERLHIETVTRTLHLLNAGACLPQDASIFINFDPSVFVDHAVADNALREMRLVLHEAGIEAGRVVCEVTEQPSASQEALYAFVEALRANGLRIAVDDYGADESDIKRIEELRPDIVKFDAQWTGQLMDSATGFALLTAMVEGFERQGIHTVFEGIEEGWQLELAERSGASMVQGFVLARPELAPTSFARPRAEVVPGAAAASDVLPPVPRPGRRPRAFGRRAAP
ncbi:EAL domain-containing protein [Mesorhizobium sp. SP-1A]|uniref:EAL domain-containing protein n=1 Tax=Mesorhizobium sp. SP-1A TaxID=3077840 RepID=UPI0028F6CA80|nr:EAL domain-containing protein [Mesorhizobium sp. SP-1A]